MIRVRRPAPRTPPPGRRTHPFFVFFADGAFHEYPRHPARHSSARHEPDFDGIDLS